MTDTAAISAMTPEQKRLFLRYGDHARQCAWRLWRQSSSLMMGYEVYSEPECDCGWLEALGTACSGG